MVGADRRGSAAPDHGRRTRDRRFRDTAVRAPRCALPPRWRRCQRPGRGPRSSGWGRPDRRCWNSHAGITLDVADLLDARLDRVDQHVLTVGIGPGLGQLWRAVGHGRRKDAPGSAGGAGRAVRVGGPCTSFGLSWMFGCNALALDQRIEPGRGDPPVSESVGTCPGARLSTRPAPVCCGGSRGRACIGRPPVNRCRRGGRARGRRCSRPPAVDAALRGAPSVAAGAR